jgi:hypothetical protein
VYRRVEAQKNNKNQSINHKRHFSIDPQVCSDDRRDDKRLRVDDVSSYSAQTSGDSTGTRNLRLMGSLELPHPRDAGLDEACVQHILNLIPHLQKLDGRNLQGKLSSNPSLVFLLIVLVELPNRIDLGQQFHVFKENELQAWKELGVVPEHQSRLIPPSGSLDSMIAHHLHQPSFTTNALADAHTTADKSNGCIAMVMGNGF